MLPPTLADPSAPEVVQALREQARDERFSRVSGLMRTKWVDVRNGDVEAAREVRAALDELLAREGQDTPDVSPE